MEDGASSAAVGVGWAQAMVGRLCHRQRCASRRMRRDIPLALSRKLWFQGIQVMEVDVFDDVIEALAATHSVLVLVPLLLLEPGPASLLRLPCQAC